jgi:hypothetical protein
LDVRSRTISAVDSASLAAGRAMLDGKLTDKQVIDVATRYFNESTKAAKGLANVGVPSIVMDRQNGTVTIDVVSTVKTTFGKFAGLTKLDIPVSSAATYQQNRRPQGCFREVR